VSARPEGMGWGSGRSSRIRVEVITYAPTVFFHCQHCEVVLGQAGIGARIHRDQARESLPEDLRAEFAHVADWVHQVLERHGPRVHVRVIDAASLQGFWKSLRYGTRTYPAVVVDGEERYMGPNLSLAELEIERRVAGSGERGTAPEGHPTREDEEGG
jgi:glutaredoxin